MYSTSLGRHSATAVQNRSGFSARLLSSTPRRAGATPGKVKIGRAGTFAGLEIPTISNSKVASNDANTSGYTKRLNKYKAGQSPTVLHPERTRSFQPGLSWLGDDEFESTGLAFKLARHQMQRAAATKPNGGSYPNRNANGKANSGSGPRRNDGTTRTRVKVSDDARKNVSHPKRGPAQNSRPKHADPPEAATPKTVNPGVPKGTVTSHQTLKLSPAPQMPTHIDFGSTDFTSLFGPSSSFSDTPSSTSIKTTAANAVSRRVQLTLEHHGGDYSKLISSSLATSHGDPLVYAASTMARRRDLGPNGRNGALEIVRGMIGKSVGSQPTP